MNELVYIFVSLASFAFGMILPFMFRSQASSQDQSFHNGHTLPLYMDHTHGGDVDDL